jgi:hypothetical protein
MDRAKTFRVNVTVAGPFGNEFVASSENATLGAGSSVPYRIFFKLYDVPSGTYRVVITLEDVESGVVVDLWGDHPDEVSDMMFNLANLVEIEDIVEKPDVIGNGDVLTISVKIANYGLIPASLKLLGLLFAENSARYSINQTDEFVVKPSSTMTAKISWDPAREEHPEEVPLGKFRVYIMLFNAHSLRITKGGETKTNPIDFIVGGFERRLKITFHYYGVTGKYIWSVKNSMSGEQTSIQLGEGAEHEGSFSMYFYPNERLETDVTEIRQCIYYIYTWATTNFEIYQIARDGKIYKGTRHIVRYDGSYADPREIRTPAVFTMQLSPRDLSITSNSAGVKVDVYDGISAAEIPANEWVVYSVKAFDAKFHEVIIQGYNPSGEDVEVKVVIDGNENEAMSFNFTEHSNKWTTQSTVLLGQSSSGGFSAGNHKIKIITQKGTAKIAKPKIQSKSTFDFEVDPSNQSGSQPGSSSSQGTLQINIKGKGMEIPGIPEFSIKGYRVKVTVGVDLDFSGEKLYLSLGVVVKRQAEPTETYEEDEEGVKYEEKHYKDQGKDSLVKGHNFKIEGYIIFEIDLTDIRDSKIYQIYVNGRLPIPGASVGVEAEAGGELRGVKKPGKIKLDAGAGFFIRIVFIYDSTTSTSTVFIGVDGSAWLEMVLEITIKIWKWEKTIPITIIDFAITLGIGVAGVFETSKITIALAIYWNVKLKILMIDLSEPFVYALTLGRSTDTHGMLVFREVSVTIYL